MTVHVAVSLAERSPSDKAFSPSLVIGTCAHITWVLTVTIASESIFFGNASHSHLDVDLFYTASVLSLIATLALISALFLFAPNSLRDNLPTWPHVALLGGVLLASSTILLTWGDVGTVPGTVLLVYAGISSGTGSALLFPLCWGRVYGCLPTPAVARNFVLGILFAFALCCIIAWAPSAIQLVFVCILPFVETVALLAAFRTVLPTASDKAVGRSDSAIAGNAKILGQLAIPSLCFGLSLNILRETAITEIFDGPSLVVSLLATLVVAAIALALQTTSRADAVLFRRFFIGTVVSLVIIATCNLAKLSPFLGALLGYLCVESLLWCLSANLVYRYHLEPLLVFGSARLFVTLGSASSTLMLKWSPLVNDQITNELFLPLLLIACLAIGYALWPRRQELSNSTRSTAADYQSQPVVSAPADLDLSCEQLARTYHLSLRECDVLKLLAVGKNAAAISDNLVISVNTSKSHIRKIYQKIGIHSQQELIAFVESNQQRGES